MTPAEKESWSARAAEVGLDLSEYIRRCVERRKMAPIQPEVNRQTMTQLGRIGVNLNQLASGDEYSNRLWSGHLQY
jgi:hypothetical protein